MLDQLVEFFKNLFKKKDKEIEAENESLFLDRVEDYQEGFNTEEQAVVCLVSNRKTKKDYRIKGIEDVSSKNNWKAWLYLAPVIVLIGIFLIYPLINTIFISFAKDYKYATGEFSGLTFENFSVLFGLSTTASGGTEVYFVKYAIPNTFILVFVTVPISTVLALLIAVALNSIKFLQKAFQIMFFLPYVTNTIAVGMVFEVLFSRTGLINYIFNLDLAWTVQQPDTAIAMVPLVIYIVWNSIPFKILIFLSGLQGIDKQYYQAAQVDAASKSKVLWKITVPLLSPQILYILVTSFMGAFKEYSSVVGLFGGPSSITKGTGGTPNMETIVYYVYDNLVSNTGYAAAAAVFLFVIILVFTVIQFQVSKTRVHY